MRSVVCELEGTLLKDPNVFSYFMLVAFEASGLIRFALLLMLWPLVRLLEACGRGDDGLRLIVFVATAGVRFSEIRAVTRAVLPKFFFDDLNMEAWRVFSACDRRVVVSKMPSVMVEMFAKDHLRAHEVIGTRLSVNRFGFATGFLERDFGSIARDVAELFRDGRPSVGVGRPTCGSAPYFLPLCQVYMSIINLSILYYYIFENL